MKLSLSANQVQSIATLANVTPAGRDVTPVLEAINVVVADGRYTATATDRYVAAEVSDHLVHHDHDGAFMLDRKAWTELAKRAKAERVDFDFTVGERTVAVSTSFGLSVGEYLLAEGNYPAVDQLFDRAAGNRAELGTVSLNPDNLTRLGKVLTAGEIALTGPARKKLGLAFTFSGGGTAAKPAPVIVHRHNAEDNGFRGLVQPLA